MGGIEQQYIVAVQRIYMNLPLYANPSQFPFFTFQHTPLFTWLLSFICRTVHIDPLSQVHDVYVAGRFISFTCNLLSAYVLYCIMTHLKVSRSLSFFIAAVSLLFLTKHNFSARPDSLKSMLVLFYIFLYLKFAGRKYVSILLFILLGILPFIKQDALILSLGTLAYLAYIKDRTGLKKMILTTGLTGIFMLALMLLIYQGDFLNNVIGTNLEYLNLKPLLFTSIQFFKKAAILLIFYAYFIIRNRNEFQKNDEWLFILFQSAFLLFFSFLLTLKFGSDIVYFGDAQNLLLVIAGLFLQQQYLRSESIRLKLASILLPLAMLLYLQFRTLQNENSPLLSSRKAEKQYKAEYDAVNRFAERTKQQLKPGDVVFPMDIRFVAFLTGNAMYGYYYIYHQFLYVCTPDYPLSYVVQNYGDEENFHQLFKEKKVGYMIFPNNNRSTYIAGKYYSDFTPYHSDSNFILLKVSQE